MIFWCSIKRNPAKDSDIENFIRSKAVEIEGLFKSRAYLLCDEDVSRGGNREISI